MTSRGTLSLTAAALLLALAPLVAVGREGGGTTPTNEARRIERLPGYRTPVRDPAAFRAGFSPSPASYQYEVTWKGAEVGAVAIALGRETGGYRIAVSAKSIRSLENLYKLRYRGEAWVPADSLCPTQSFVRQQQQSRSRQSLLVFPPGGMMESTVTRRKADGPIRRQSYLLDRAESTFDPLCVALAARAVAWQPGTEVAFEVCDGRGLHLVALRCQGRKKIEVMGRSRDVWVVRPRVRRVDCRGNESLVADTADPPAATPAGSENDDPTVKDDLDDLKIEIYLTADPACEIVGAVGHSVVGEIRARVERITQGESETHP
jgi:hypothetical protein